MATIATASLAPIFGASGHLASPAKARIVRTTRLAEPERPGVSGLGLSR
jgi:hypothetical protein